VGPGAGTITGGSRPSAGRAGRVGPAGAGEQPTSSTVAAIGNARTQVRIPPRLRRGRRPGPPQAVAGAGPAGPRQRAVWL